MSVHKDQDRIEKVVELAAPVPRVWRALTDYKEFGTWFRVRLDNPFEVGTTTTGTMTSPGHESMPWVSVTEELEHQRLFAFSWPPSAIDPDTVYSEEAKVRVEFRLEPTANGTRLTITEAGFQQFPEAKRLEVLRSNEQGWEIQARNVAAHVVG
ncbi:MAG: SRPBCC family protein [Deltaproteobacteria bacterium]|nr:SRPBCC family protein [Deltaproteobacteria bacterium]